MKAMIMILAVICIGWTTVGCVSSRDESVYSRDAAMRAQEVEMATVEHLAIVKLEGTRSGAGGALGGTRRAAASRRTGGDARRSGQSTGGGRGRGGFHGRRRPPCSSASRPRRTCRTPTLA